MADTFKYKDRQGNATDRPLEPSWLDKVYENLAFPPEIDTQRAQALGQTRAALPPSAPKGPVREWTDAVAEEAARTRGGR